MQTRVASRLGFESAGRRARSAEPDGDGIALALVDYGFDVRHPAMIGGSGFGRLSVLHDQNSHRTFCASDLDAMAGDDAVAAYRDYDPHANYYDATAARHGAHGAMMASLAARAAAVPVDLLAVQLRLAEADWREIDTSGRPSWLEWQRDEVPVWPGWRSYLESQSFVEALEWAVGAAQARGDLALVLNLSLGTWAGAHDGRSAVERAVARLIDRGSNGRGPLLAVVVPTGNAGADRGHASTLLAPNGAWTLTWQIETASIGPHKLEIWCDSDQPPAAEIRVRGQAIATDIAEGVSTEIRLGDTRIGVADARPAASGPLSSIRISASLAHVPVVLPRAIDVSITLRAMSSRPVRIHTWIERSGDGHPHSSLAPHDPLSTIGGLATAPGAIVVGATDATRNETSGRVRSLALSGRGPHPWTGEPLPHLVRPGHRLPVPRSKTAGMTLTTGTSAATAIASGDLVRRLAEARRAARADGRPVRPALADAIQSFKQKASRAAPEHSTVLDPAETIAP